jgi:hypothetical protein
VKAFVVCHGCKGSIVEPFGGECTQPAGGSRLVPLQAHQTISSMAERPVLLRHIVDSSAHLKTVLDLVGGVASVSFRILTLRLSVETYRHQINPIANVAVKALNGLLVVNHSIAACQPSLTIGQSVQNYNDFEGDMTDLGATMHDFLSFLIAMESTKRIDRLKRKAMSILQAISQTSTFIISQNVSSVSLIIYARRHAYLIMDADQFFTAQFQRARLTNFKNTFA